MSKVPSVAIITRTKNRPVLLRRAIESVINQTYHDWFLVIVNDGGDKEPVDALVKEYSEPLKGKHKTVHNKHSLGMEAASNKGVHAQDSTYVVIHDDDDAWHPTFLQRSVDYLENNTTYPNLGGVVCTIEKVIERIEGDVVTELYRENCTDWIKALTLWNLCHQNCFPPISFLYKREVYDVIGGAYNEKLPVLGDWEFNLRFLEHFDIGHIPDVLAYYYHREANTNGQYANTVVDGVDKHTFYKDLLCNQLLREDLKQGKLGKGYLMNIAGNLVPMRYESGEIIYRVREMEKIPGLIRRIEKLLTPFRWIVKKWNNVKARYIKRS